MISPQQLVIGFIREFEGGLSLDPVDRGNWHCGKLVGSKYGVTGAALAAHRGVKCVTAKEMADLRIEEAADIGVKAYMQTPGYEYLPWNRVTMNAVDMGWGAGPVWGIKLLQRVVGANDDGKLSKNGETFRKFNEALASVGEEELARRYTARRIKYYDDIIASRPANAKYRKGWTRRANSFLPGTPWWTSAGK